VARNLTLLSRPLATAGTFIGDAVALAPGTRSVGVESKFVRAAGGTSCKVYLQTTFDDGATWVDIAAHAFLITTASKLSSVKGNIATAAAVVPGDGILTDDTILDGVLGDRIRAKVIVAGTYSGASSITVCAVAN
jgi:hypothetical protein